MSEMLGNQYFLTRRYFEACSELESESQKNPKNYSIKKKLIICYLQTNNLKKAFHTFFETVKKDIELIKNTDLIHDDCPCPEIIEQNLPDMKSESTAEQYVKMGILYLYCDINESIKYFEKVPANSEYYADVKEVLSIEKSQINKIN